MKKNIFIPGSASAFPNYVRAVERFGWTAVFAPQLPPEHCHALLLPGGGDIAPWRYGEANTASNHIDEKRDALEFDLLEHFTAAKKPILAICRGLQAVNVFFGGSLLQDIPGHAAVNGADTLHPLSDGSIVNSAHHQAVNCPGSNLIPTQWAADGIIEALRHRSLPILAVQWHPERLHANNAGQRLFQAFFALAEKNCPKKTEKSLEIP